MSSSFWWFASRTDATPIGGHLEESPRKDAPSKAWDSPAPTLVVIGVRGAIVLFDNRRMGAISGLQQAQYGADFRTSDSVPVDYVQMAASVPGVKALSGGFDPSSLEAALEEAFDHDGLSLIHVPVYYGDDPRGGMGAYGRWNVGNWCDDVQDRYVRTLI